MYQTASINNNPVAVQLSEPGNKPNLGLYRPAPFLPLAIQVQRGVGSAFYSNFVIDVGEPVALWRQVTSGGIFHWVVPAVGTTACRITYTADDVAAKVLDIDTGLPVTAPKTSTATIPALPPVGVALARVDKNPLGLDLQSIFENYGEGIATPTIIARGALATYPYVRFGPNAQVPGYGVDELTDFVFKAGDFVRAGNVYGGTLSATNRPHIAKDNGPAVCAVDVADAKDTDTVTLTLNGSAQAARTRGGGADWSSAATLKTALDAQIATAKLSDFIKTSVDGDVVIIQSYVYGVTCSVAVGAVAGTPIAYNLSDGLGANFRLGKVFRVFPAIEEKYPELNTDPTLPLPTGMVVNPTGIETIAGQATGGVPQQLLVRGNSTSDETPSGATARSKAGVVEVLI